MTYCCALYVSRLLKGTNEYYQFCFKRMYVQSWKISRIASSAAPDLIKLLFKAATPHLPSRAGDDEWSISTKISYYQTSKLGEKSLISPIEVGCFFLIFKNRNRYYTVDWVQVFC